MPNSTKNKRSRKNSKKKEIIAFIHGHSGQNIFQVLCYSNEGKYLVPLEWELNMIQNVQHEDPIPEDKIGAVYRFPGIIGEIKRDCMVVRPCENTPNRTLYAVRYEVQSLADLPPSKWIPPSIESPEWHDHTSAILQSLYQSEND